MHRHDLDMWIKRGHLKHSLPSFSNLDINSDHRYHRSLPIYPIRCSTWRQALRTSPWTPVMPAIHRAVEHSGALSGVAF